MLEIYDLKQDFYNLQGSYLVATKELCSTQVLTYIPPKKGVSTVVSAVVMQN